MKVITAIFGRVSSNGKWHILKDWGSTISLCNKYDVGYSFSNLHRIREANQVSKICKKCLKMAGE